MTKVNVEVGDRVSAGDVLATIDNTGLKLAVIQAKETLADAQVSLDNAQTAADAAASASASPSASTSPTATAAKPSPSAASSPKPTSKTSHSASPTKWPERLARRPRRRSPPDPGPADRSPADGPESAGRAEHGQQHRARGRTDHVCGPVHERAHDPAHADPERTNADPTEAPAHGHGESQDAEPHGHRSPSPSATDPRPAGRPAPIRSATPTPPPSRTPVASADPATLARCIAAVVDVQQHQDLVAVQQAVVDRAVAAVVAKATSTQDRPAARRWQQRRRQHAVATATQAGRPPATSRNAGSAQSRAQTTADVQRHREHRPSRLSSRSRWPGRA